MFLYKTRLSHFRTISKMLDNKNSVAQLEIEDIKTKSMHVLKKKF